MSKNERFNRETLNSSENFKNKENLIPWIGSEEVKYEPAEPSKISKDVKNNI